MADITPGDGQAQTTDLGLSLAELEALGDQKVDTKPEETKTPETTDAGKAPEDDKKPEGADDKKPEGDKTDEEDKGDEKADEPQEDTEATAKFFEEVNKLHGFNDFKVEYPEGVDPLSPEGIHVRDKALIERGQLEMDEYLKKTDPRSYAYILHRQAGGSDEAFFANQTPTLPEYDSFKNSVDLQKQVLSRDLASRGVDQDIIDATVEKAIKDGKLFEKADKAWKGADTAEKTALANAEQAAVARQRSEQAAIKSITDSITDVVMNSKVSNIVIPDAKRAEFAEHIKQHLYFDGEKFFLNKPIDKDTLAEAIQAEYFGFVKGNMKDLVERRAKTQVANRLQINTGKTKTGAKSAADSGSSKGYVPLGDL
jgi:hypothetical protein